MQDSPDKTTHYSIMLAFSLLIIFIASPVDAAELSADVIEDYTSLNPFSFILLEFGLIIILALVGHIFSRIYHLPNLLGELIIGVIAGNILYWLDLSPVFFMLMHMGDAGEVFKSIWTSNLSVAETVSNLYSMGQPETQVFDNRMIEIFSTKNSPMLVLLGIALWIFSNLGVFLLLFKLGLETKTEELIEAAEPLAFLISLTGTFVPFFLGLGVGLWLLPEASTSMHIFLAATLCTTSVAITGSMFSYFQRHQSREAKLVIHAAFLDDIFGIFFLSFITNLVLGDTLSVFEIITMFFYSALIFVGIIVFGKQLIKHVPQYYKFDQSHTQILIPTLVIVLVSWLANLFNIGVISGAFIAGMVLNTIQDKKGLIKSLIKPLEEVFSPIFFVFVGMQVNLKQLLIPETLWLTLVLLIAAVAGKIAAGFVTRHNLNSYAIGLGMVPRGEAVLVFISIGKILGIIDDSLFTVITLIVLISNFIAPWALNRFCAQKCHDDSFIIKP